jgi:hypothetical protein
MMNRAILLLTIFAALAVLNGVDAAGPVPVAREDELKAAYVFNFAKFVEWPAATPPNVLLVCFAGAPGVHAAFTGNQDKLIGSRRIVSRALSAGEDVSGCAILYLDYSAQSQPATQIHASGATLTISATPGFTRNGGMIEIFSEGNRLRFNINQENAKRAGLKISSNLLRLASRVE